MKAFIVAIPEEVNFAQTIFDCPVYISGVGKVKAAIAAVKACLDGVTELINIGSCASTKHAIGTIHRIHSFYQDMDLMPINYTSEVLEVASGDSSCFTTDIFYDKSKELTARYKRLINHCDVIDMESYAIAEACAQYDVGFAAFKWVTDDGSGYDWQSNKNISYTKFLQTYENLFISDS